MPGLPLLLGVPPLPVVAGSGSLLQAAPKKAAQASVTLPRSE